MTNTSASGAVRWVAAGLLLLPPCLLMGACGDDGAAAQEPLPPAYSLDPRQIEDTIRRVADHALETPSEQDPRHWSMAALYDGLIDASLATGDPRYLAAVLRAGRRIQFGLGSRTYHADGHAAGHAWLRLYLMQRERDRDPKMLEPFKEQFDEIVENPIPDDVSFGQPPPPGRRVTDRWSWADALYMSPPTVSLLALATGDDRYLEWMDHEFRFAYDKLYDEEEHLWWRDSTYVDQRTPNGKKVFWSRGNAWVYAGTALMLEYLPDDWETRPFYEDLVRDMSGALARAQQPDGFWYPSLLDPEHVAAPETSGTAFFLFGMADGATEGILGRATFRPVAERAWNAILTQVDADGEVDSVQGFGEAPVPFDPESHATYGTGAVLMAGARLLRALGAAATVDPEELFDDARALVDEAPDLSSVCEDCVAP